MAELMEKLSRLKYGDKGTDSYVHQIDLPLSNFNETPTELVIHQKNVRECIGDSLGVAFGLILTFSPLYQVDFQSKVLNLFINSTVVLVGLGLLVGFSISLIGLCSLGHFKITFPQVDKSLLKEAEEVNMPCNRM